MLLPISAPRLLPHSRAVPVPFLPEYSCPAPVNGLEKRCPQVPPPCWTLCVGHFASKSCWWVGAEVLVLVPKVDATGDRVRGGEEPQGWPQPQQHLPIPPCGQEGAGPELGQASSKGQRHRQPGTAVLGEELCHPRQCLLGLSDRQGAVASPGANPLLADVTGVSPAW